MANIIRQSNRRSVRGGTQLTASKRGARTYGRKAYVADSYSEFIRRIPYNALLQQNLMRKSQFDKPYRADSYEEMEQYAPTIPSADFGWPDRKVPPFRGPIPQPGDEYGRLTFCSLTCWDDSGDYDDDCDELYAECHVAVQSLGGYGQWGVSGSPLAKIEYYNDRACIEKTVVGKRSSKKNAGLCIKIFPAWDSIESIGGEKKAKYTVSYVNQYGNKCYRLVEVRCKDVCVCATEPDVSYDAGNPTTIGQSDADAITISDGCAPFNWSVSGTGFSFASVTTRGRTNTLNTSTSACGTGTITVTDHCGDSCTGYVRCTADSQWVLKSNNVCELSGNGTTTNAYSYELISGYKKQTQSTESKAAGTSGSGCGENQIALCEGHCPEHGCESGCCLTCDNCIDPDHTFPCQSYDGVPDWRCWCVASLAYYEWECTE